MSSWLAVSEDDDTDEDFAPGQPPAPYHADGSAKATSQLETVRTRKGIAIAATVALRMSWREKQLGGGRHVSWETYRSALAKQGGSSPGQAEWLETQELYRGIIQDIITFPPWIKQQPLQRQRTGPVNPQSLPVRLQYLCTKQLATIANREGDCALSLKCYVAALRGRFYGHCYLVPSRKGRDGDHSCKSEAGPRLL